MADWQPIETAPKDGNGLIAALYSEEGEFAGIETIRWHEPWNEWVLSACLIHIYNSGDPGDDVFPRHWMPLPAPPLPAA